VEKVRDSVLIQSFESKTPKGWKVTGQACLITASAATLALTMSITPAGWITWGVMGLLILSSALGTWAGYQTDDPELKNLWKKPFAIFKKKKG